MFVDIIIIKIIFNKKCQYNIINSYKLQKYTYPDAYYFLINIDILHSLVKGNYAIFIE